MDLVSFSENGVTCLRYTPITNSIKFLTPNHFSPLRSHYHHKYFQQTGGRLLPHTSARCLTA